MKIHKKLCLARISYEFHLNLQGNFSWSSFHVNFTRHNKRWYDSSITPVHNYSNLILCVLVLRRSVFYHIQPTALWIPPLFLPSVPPLLKPGELNYNWHLWYTDKINLHPDNRLWCTDLVPVQLPSLPAPFSDDQWIHTTPRGLPLASQTVPPNWHISGGYRNKA